MLCYPTYGADAKVFSAILLRANGKSTEVVSRMSGPILAHWNTWKFRIARIRKEPGARTLPAANEITVVAERVYGIADSAEGQASCPSVLLHPDRGNERSARFAR
jgi:hypothetical protein